MTTIERTHTWQLGDYVQPMDQPEKASAIDQVRSEVYGTETKPHIHYFVRLKDEWFDEDEIEAATPSQDAMCALLLDVFVPVVEEEAALGDDLRSKLSYSVTHLEDCQCADIYLLNVALPKQSGGNDVCKIVTGYDMYLISLALDAFGVYEGSKLKVAGRDFQIGDGDDTLAVQFWDNAFHIWIRDFKGSDVIPDDHGDE